MYFLLMLSTLSIVRTSVATFPICANTTLCPPTGLWSEWAFMGNGNCPTNCGACSKLYQIRKCVSLRFNCSCIGDSSRQYPCNPQTCGWPSQRTCCIPYVSVKVNGTNQCGPLPKDTGAIPCCRDGGVWTDWSGYSTTDDGKEWFRSRECLSAAGGCPCNGAEVENIGATCPCPPPNDITDAKNYIAGTSPGKLGRPFVVNVTDCTAYVFYDKTNVDPIRYCKTDGSGLSLRVETATGAFQTVTPVECWDESTGVQFQQRFTCDLISLLWIYDATTLPIKSITQLQFV